MKSLLERGIGFFNKPTFSYPGPVHVALSGGRSSAAMLRLLLEHYDGKLPDNWYVVFTNTAAEHPATYEFIHKIETQWSVPVVWLELDKILGENAVTYKQVSYATYSKKHEPFYELMRAKPTFPPRSAHRLCTVYEKVLPAAQFIRDIAGVETSKLLGFRADEYKRLHRARMRCGRDKNIEYYPYAPLAEAGLDERTIIDWFAEQSFDLETPPLCGNCVFCFMKPPHQLQTLGATLPDVLEEWIALENTWNVMGNAALSKIEAGRVSTFNMMPGGYKRLKQQVLSKLPPDHDEDLTDLECNCTD